MKLPRATVRSFLLLLGTLPSMSCGLFVQDSVTFHGTQCSDSRFWMGTDILFAGGMAYLASTNGAPAESYIPVAAFATSAAAGWYKRKNCLHHQRNASPEEWARDAEKARREDEARFRAMQQMRENMRRNQQQGGRPSGSSNANTTPNTSTSRPSGGNPPPAPRPTPPPTSGERCGNTTCSASQRCVTYLAGSKQCAPGGQCWTVESTEHVCKPR